MQAFAFQKSIKVTVATLKKKGWPDQMIACISGKADEANHEAQDCFDMACKDLPNDADVKALQELEATLSEKHESLLKSFNALKDDVVPAV